MRDVEQPRMTPDTRSYMKKGLRRSVILFCVLVAVLALCAPVQARYSGGSGQPNDPYLIATAEDLNDIGNHEDDFDRQFEMVADIDLTQYGPNSFNIIATDSETPFKGVFQANGHRVTGFTRTAQIATSLGLFGYLGYATIEGITIENPDVNSPNSYVGALAGRVTGGLIRDCRVIGGSVTGLDDIGGLIGEARYACRIERCRSTARVVGLGDSIGGLVGRCDATVIYSSASGEVSGERYVGGLIGYKSGSSEVCKSYSGGRVTGTSGVGGLVGTTSGYAVVRCYSSAIVTGQSYVGGVTGTLYPTSQEWSFYDGTLNPSIADTGEGAALTIMRLTTSQMQSAAVFSEYGWDFAFDSRDGYNDLWAIPPGGGYPVLWYELQDPPPLYFEAGDGSEEAPYLISNASQLRSIGDNPRLMSAHFRMVSDIDLESTGFEKIGRYTTLPFSGVFDGGGFEIRGYESDAAMFDYVVGPSAVIRNVVLLEPKLESLTVRDTGVVVANIRDGLIENCHVIDGNVSGSRLTGGIVGLAQNTAVTDCSYSGSVLGLENVGGIAGAITGTIEHCTFSGFVVGSYYDAGGIAGVCTGSIVDSHADGHISNQGSAGGLVGTVKSRTGVEDYIYDRVKNCSFTGSVTGQQTVGGLIAEAGEYDPGSSGGGNTRTGIDDTGGIGLDEFAVIDCWANADVNSYFVAGGLVGTYGGTMSACSSQGHVFVWANIAGGLIGQGGGLVANCYSSCDVTAYGTAGGLVGSPQGVIERCYSIGRVEAYGDAGGFVGEPTSATGCFWDIQASGQGSSYAGWPATTAIMQDPNTFIAVGWDFVGELGNGSTDYWVIPEGGGYPVLAWQLGIEPAIPVFAGGAGEPNNPFLIGDGDELAMIADNPLLMDKHFRLLTDIDFRYNSMKQIGTSWQPFRGVFDGNDHTISYAEAPLFPAVIGPNAVISNLSVDFALIDSTGDSALVDYLAMGTISNCHADYVVVNTSGTAGALLGQGHQATVHRCSSFAEVNTSGGAGAGGLIGTLEGYISESSSYATVVGADYVGGLVGLMNGTISQSFSQGRITGSKYVGGLAGRADDAIDSYSHVDTTGVEKVGGLIGLGTATRCYSTGVVIGGKDTGGLIGANATDFSLGPIYDSAEYSFWDVNSSGRPTGVSGLPRTTDQMMRAETFFGWGESGVWTIDEGRDYPRLLYENMPGDLIVEDDPMEGEGTAEDPLIVKTPRHLLLFLFNPRLNDVYVRMTGDIEFPAGTNIGPLPGRQFHGKLDGQGHAISNVTMNFRGVPPQDGSGRAATSEYGQVDGGLIGTLAEGASVSNLTLRNVSVVASRALTVGVLAGRVDSAATLSNVRMEDVTVSADTCANIGGLVGVNSGTITAVTGNVIITSRNADRIGGVVGDNAGLVESCDIMCTVSGNDYVGGIAGASAGTVGNCRTAANVQGESSVGGLVGGGSGGTTTNCQTTGEVSGSGAVGGVIGNCYGYGSILDCTADCNVNGLGSIGGMVGTLESSTTKRCDSRGTVTGDLNVGGFAGYIDDHSNSQGILQCSADCNVTGSENVGGFAGMLERASITECFSTGYVAGDDNAGGLVGHLDFGSAQDSYSQSQVTALHSVGGLIGYVPRADTIDRCYSTGLVLGESDVGGLIGLSNEMDVVKYCFWDVMTSDANNSSAGLGLTTEQLMMPDTYDNWAWPGRWTIQAGLDYPRLSWQNLGGSQIDATQWFAGGTGQRDDPYLVETPEQLNRIGVTESLLDKRFRLIADVDLSQYTGLQFNIIGSGDTGFSGLFDGDNHTVSNFTYQVSDCNCIGLFGSVTGAVINLTMVDPNIDANDCDFVGAIVGSYKYTYSGEAVQNCRVTGGSVLGRDYVGGLLGMGSQAQNCHAATSVSGRNFVGGLAGAARLTDCSSTGNVSGAGDDIGGLVGASEVLVRCSAHGNVTGRNSIGGLAGSGIHMTDCNASGNVTAQDSIVYDAGGLAGRIDNGILRRCSATGDVASFGGAGGLVGEVFKGSLYECFATGNVTAKNRSAGGLVAHTLKEFASSTVYYITNCYATGDVKAGQYVGGLVNSCASRVSYCYATGHVTGSDRGGLIGTHVLNDYDASWVYMSYWDTEASGVDYSAGGYGRTTRQMQQVDNYVEWIAQDVWAVDPNGGYLRLLWEDDSLLQLPYPQYSGGTGLPNDPYLISTADDMVLLAATPSHWSSHFRLTADIHMSQATLSGSGRIGRSRASHSPGAFSGVFDGDGHAIRGLEISVDQTDYVGLFGCVEGADAQIRNLRIVEPNVLGENCHCTGTLVGYLETGTVVNCSVEGGQVLGDHMVGGLVGDNNGHVFDCSFQGSVDATGSHVGGLVGDVSGQVSRCCSIATVHGKDDVGGLVGYTHGDVLISESFTAGSASATNLFAGGLVGYDYSSGTGPYSILNCYSTCTLAGDSYVGGLIGYRKSGIISNCYFAGTIDEGVSSHAGGLFGYPATSANYARECAWDVTLNPNLSAGDFGLSTEDMQNASTYESWICDGAWTIDDGVDYPRLLWEDRPGLRITNRSYGGGTGSGDDPYLIYTIEQLRNINVLECDAYKHYRLVADLDFAQYAGEPFMIGPFYGVFDGNNCRILNYHYETDSGSEIGLFSKLTGGRIEYLGMIDPNIIAAPGVQTVGSLVGNFDSGVVACCYVRGGCVAGGDTTGGLIGYAKGDVYRCRAMTRISGQENVGGLIGKSEGSVLQCYSDSDVAAVRYVGGLIGYVYRTSLSQCYSRGLVAGEGYVGGLIGYDYSTSSDNHATQCYSCAVISGPDASSLGGLVGTTTSDYMNLCFWDVQASGRSNSSSGVGLTTAQLMNPRLLISAGWDLVGEDINGSQDIWTIDPSRSYPMFVWELVDLTGDGDVGFDDYACMADFWRRSDCRQSGNCSGADLDFSGTVDWIDLRTMARHWLERSP